MTKLDLLGLLHQLRQREGTDLLLKAGRPPLARIGGELVPLGDPLGLREVAQMVLSVMTESQMRRFEEQRELDLAISFPGAGRFRMNAFYEVGAPAAVLRPVSETPRPLEELGLPRSLEDLLSRPSGLILVCGPAGSGKTSTLASMVDWINERRPVHIITVEDPVEYVHRDKRGTVTQREVGTDTKDFPTALRSALRQSPDVIVIGEVRDLETARTLLIAAETGHLVLASSHGGSAPEGIERLVHAFPDEEREAARRGLAEVLLAVIYLHLVRRADGKGKALAYEFLVSTPAIRTLIREGKTHQIRMHMAQGEEMATLEATLAELYRRGVISLEEALARAGEKREVLWRINGFREA